MSVKHIYRVVFVNQDDIYEMYAREVMNSELYGFIDVVELLFGEASSVVVDPSEERLKTEFTGVKKTLVPIHSIIRIDEVEKTGVVKIKSSNKDSNISQFPGHLYSPRNDDSKTT